MNAPDLPARILAAVAKATSQRPARAPDVLALVGGEEPAFWAAVEQLYRERRINTAHIQKRGDAEPWLAVWPTGLPVTSGAWTADSHSALFVKHRPDDLFLAHAPRSIVKPERAPKAARKPKPVSIKEPVMDAPTKTRRAKRSPQSTPRIEEAGAETAAGAIEGANEAAAVPSSVVTDRWACSPRVAEPDRGIEFALWSDGRLDIMDGDELFQIPPGAVIRLALLLGVPGTSNVSNLGA